MSGAIEFVGTVVKRFLIAALLLFGLLLGMLIALKVLIVVMVVKLYRRMRGPSVKPVPGNVFEGEFSVVTPEQRRATVLIVPPPVKVSTTGAN